MNKIKFNNDVEMEVINYNKTTEFLFDGTIRSSAYCYGYINDVSTITTLAEDTITSISITHDSTLIYNLPEVNARIDSITESLEQEKMGITINFSFDTNTSDVI